MCWHDRSLGSCSLFRQIGHSINFSNPCCLSGIPDDVAIVMMYWIINTFSKFLFSKTLFLVLSSHYDCSVCSVQIVSDLVRLLPGTHRYTPVSALCIVALHNVECLLIRYIIHHNIHLSLRLTAFTWPINMNYWLKVVLMLVHRL